MNGITMTDSALNGLIAQYARAVDDPDRMRQGFSALLRRNSDASASELQLRALSMLPRCDRDTAARFVIELLHLMPTADPLLAGALIRQVWTPGQDGHPLMPDLRLRSKAAYRAQRDFLTSWLTAHTRHHDRGAERLLCDEDLAFFSDLPAEVAIYRGAAGVSGDLAAEGLAWTLDPAFARSFADAAADISGGAPVVVAAWIKVKKEVLTCFADAAEIVATPGDFRIVTR